MDIATCMYHTGLDPQTLKPVYSAKRAKDRGHQRALLQYFKPENHALVKQVLLEAGRGDLIGDGPECLIPASPPRTRAQKAERAGGKAPGAGYRRPARTRVRRPG
jgi:hypothetical protein